MRWQNREESDHVEDRRGQGGMPLRGLPIGGKGGGALLLIAVLVAGYFGFDLTPLLGMFGGGSEITMSQSSAEADPRDEQLAKFTSVALRSTEDAWGGIFQRAGQRYDPPTLVLYSGTTDTACGYGESAMGPFYCPADQKVYIDLAFYRDMENKLGGGGDFALGYVLAHEVGHHVQNEMGISREVRQRMAQSSKTDANKLSVMQELQADCFAGVWGNMARRQGMLESGDLEEALNTATAIGDDRLQRQSMGRVVPDSFTHGTSRQRVYWFRRGFDSGDPGQCNTFAGVN